MSNVISVKGLVRLSPEDFDVKRLQADVAKSESYDGDNYVMQNLRYYVEGAIAVMRDGSIVWDPMLGWSAHTWRSLCSTVATLGEYLLRDTVEVQVLAVADVEAYQGVEYWGVYTCHFANKRWWDRLTSEELKKVRYGESVI